MNWSDTKADTGGSGSSLGKNQTLRKLEAVVEGLTGFKADVLRRQTLTEMRRATEARTKHTLGFPSKFPLIGRGNVMRDKLVDHDSIEEDLAKVLV